MKDNPYEEYINNLPDSERPKIKTDLSNQVDFTSIKEWEWENSSDPIGIETGTTWQWYRPAPFSLAMTVIREARKQRARRVWSRYKGGRR
jgi:hypothetical protein